MTGPHILRDEAGRLRGDRATMPAVLADFLETEVRGGRRRCEALLAAVEAVAAGRADRREDTGNLYGLTLVPGRARIMNLFDDRVPPLFLSLEELRMALLAWRDRLP